MKFTLLYSDALLLVLMIAIFAMVRAIRTNPQTAKKWRYVFQSRVGSASFIIIAFYLLIAILDSIHYRQALPEVVTKGVDKSAVSSQVHYSSEVNSVLDFILADLKANSETTYSAPFSLYSFAKENQTDSLGRIYRDYPRLKFAGSHIDDPSDQASDILKRSAIALGQGLLISLALVGLIKVVLIILVKKQSTRLNQNQTISYLPQKTIYLMLTFLIVSTTWAIDLGSVYHIFGTDKVGTDVFYQAVKAIRTGVLIGTLATILTLPLAIGLGISAGYFKGLIDDVVQYIYTTLNSIPGILLIAASILLIDVYIETHQSDFNLTIERADFKFLSLCLILGLTSWTGLCRLLRAETLKISQLDYVQAAHAFGVPHRKVISRHILPNVTHIILIALVLDFSAFVLAESVLSYIGVGVDASMNSWGNMINAARSELSRDPTVWWSVTAAFSLMFVLVLAANLFADEVRDAFDPRIVKSGIFGIKRKQAQEI